MMLFTVLAGAAQGLVVALFGVEAARALGLAVVPDAMLLVGLAITLVFGACGLAAATFHLGHPMRAWRAAAMWRTSWLSREVIVLPAFLGAVLAWVGLLVLKSPGLSPLLPAAAAAVLSLALFVCTGMIYAAIKAMHAWATPLTPLNFALIGLASGGTLACALAALWAAPAATALLPSLAGWTLACTLLAAVGRITTLRRSLRGAMPSTLQSALGIRHPRIALMAAGTLAPGFNEREFEHGRSAATLARVRWAAAIAGFAGPAAVLALPALHRPLPLLLAFAVQIGGLLAERWHFFAEARHTQNLYTAGRR
jgi:sulfite dehydrogenase (quinone) subunit SoeC